MRDLASSLRWLKWPLVALAGLIALLLAGVIGTAALVEAGYLHEPIRKLFVAKAHREIRVLGPVTTHLISRHPSLTAERVVIQNPPWMPAGILAEIGKVSFDLETPTLAEPLRFRRLELQSATFNLSRDASGKANWRSTSGRMGRTRPPLMGSLSVPDAWVHLRDARRHLTFDGKVSTIGLGADNLRIDGAGRLNTRPMTLAIVADSLATARRDKRYRFRFEERSSGSTIVGHGALASPFDVRKLQSTLEASGEDPKDLYFLVGVIFPDTGSYRMSGKLQRSGLQFTFTKVHGETGESDIAGIVHVDSTGARTQLTADLHSGQLRLVDLGKLKLNTLVAHVKVDRGVLTAAPVSAEFADGSATGQWTFDGSKDLFATRVALAIDGLQLGQFGRRDEDQPPLEGLMRGRLQLAGRGRSPHELAASADGTLTSKALVFDTEPVLIAGTGGVDLDSEALDFQIRGHPKHVGVRLRTPLAAIAAFIDPGRAQDADCAALKATNDG